MLPGHPLAADPEVDPLHLAADQHPIPHHKQNVTTACGPARQHPGLARQLGRVPVVADPLTLVLARDGHPIAHAGSHGAWLEWRR
jgi:hypothetical protein